MYSRKKLQKVLLYGGLVGIMLILFACKRNYHVDELLSFILANGEGGFSIVNGEIYSPANIPFVEAMAADGELDLVNVWKQQVNDVHPPFYYVLLHIICTIFPNTVSIRYAALINIFFQVLTLYFIRKILEVLLLNEKYVNIISIAYILSAGILSISTFLRMYVMSMFLLVLITYLFLKNISEYKAKDLVWIYIVTVSAGLTHYYNLIYLFFASLLIGLLMIFEKRGKEIGMFIVTMLAAGGSALFIFPAMVKHIFYSARGTESIGNLNTSDLTSQLDIYREILDSNVFGGTLILILGIIFFTLFLHVFREEDSERWLAELEKKRYICMLVPCFLYLVVVSKSAPYNTDRYISPIYGVVFVAVLSLFVRCLEYYLENEKTRLFVFIVFVSVIIVNVWKDSDWLYLNLHTKEMLEYAEVEGGVTDAVCIYDTDWKVLPSYLEISKCRSVIFYEAEDYATYLKEAKQEKLSKNIAFFIIGTDKDEFITSFIKDHPEYEICKENGYFGYGVSIWLKSK